MLLILAPGAVLLTIRPKYLAETRRCNILNVVYKTTQC